MTIEIQRETGDTVTSDLIIVTVTVSQGKTSATSTRWIDADLVSCLPLPGMERGFLASEGHTALLRAIEGFFTAKVASL